MTGAGDDFVRPTTDSWQAILPADDPAGRAVAPYRYGYPARLPDGRILVLPLRRLPATPGEGRGRAVASLIANQASFAVCETLADFMAGLARAAGAEAIVGLPTLGLVLAPLVARRLGQASYLPFGYSRKFWYREALSEPVRSITSPGGAKSLYVDPNLLPRLAGRRVVVVDDAVSSGSTLVSALSLLGRLDCRLAGVVVAMRQGVAWRARLAGHDPALPALVRGVFAGPLFERVEDGWMPIPGTLDEAAGDGRQTGA
ncbi:Adenine/guanine phosphoribosyltransferase [Tistlia consotensis]|uniref:Adenine/guanine phosphoribosyltransferase n=1 Tax=Tistlia consotensis USBA 355 TaxID=560819 RepID=A0A1Y6C4X4_9PROT|nr:phosphoribosyltransferase [Tistlia consotensis]SMF37140.1 Adenine/guanine phosphoribosyltransferase [Tistlia consotensis USBA 355]SNR72496.1 Adenine/guanine phosphoribosyltransferase [Tistlia consotensis]